MAPYGSTSTGSTAATLCRYVACKPAYAKFGGDRDEAVNRVSRESWVWKHFLPPELLQCDIIRRRDSLRGSRMQNPEPERDV